MTATQAQVEAAQKEFTALHLNAVRTMKRIFGAEVGDSVDVLLEQAADQFAQAVADAVVAADEQSRVWQERCHAARAEVERLSEWMLTDPTLRRAEAAEATMVRWQAARPIFKALYDGFRSALTEEAQATACAALFPDRPTEPEQPVWCDTCGPVAAAAAAEGEEDGA